MEIENSYSVCSGKVVHHCVDAAAEGIKKYSDPLQGGARDCAVLAALSSIQAIAHDRLSGAYPTYNFKSGSVTLGTKRIPVDSTGVKVYANSKGGSWPMLWEKAYAKLKSAATCPKPATCPYRDTCNGEPDIGAAFPNGDSGLSAMMEIGRYQDFVTGALIINPGTGYMLAPSIGTTNGNFTEDFFWKCNHEYSILAYKASTNKYLIRNPCGGQELWVNATEFTAGSSPHFALWGYVKNPI